MRSAGVAAVLIASESLDMGMNTLFKSSTSKGMSSYVFITYSNTFALFLLLLPMALIRHRNTRPPPIPTSLMLGIFALSLISVFVQTLLYTGIKYASPTLASALQDLIPAFTFILAIICRMEKVDFKRHSSQAKSIGSVVSICGALFVTLYKELPLMGGGGGVMISNVSVQTSSPSSDWIKGGLLLALSSFGVSGLYVVKTWIAKQYPSKLVVMSITCCFVSTISFIIAVIAERNSTGPWMLTSDMLFSIVYSAIFSVTARNLVNLWACGKKGPVFVSIFKPLGMVIAFALGVIFLGDTLYLSSLIGAAIISIGFYGVIWGQAQEDELHCKSSCSTWTTSSVSAPLLEKDYKHLLF